MASAIIILNYARILLCSNIITLGYDFFLNFGRVFYGTAEMALLSIFRIEDGQYLKIFKNGAFAKIAFQFVTYSGLQQSQIVEVWLDRRHIV